MTFPTGFVLARLIDATGAAGVPVDLDESAQSFNLLSSELIPLRQPRYVMVVGLHAQGKVVGHDHLEAVVAPLPRQIVLGIDAEALIEEALVEFGLAKPQSHMQRSLDIAPDVERSPIGVYDGAPYHLQGLEQHLIELVTRVVYLLLESRLVNKAQEMTEVPLMGHDGRSEALPHGARKTLM